MLSLAGRYDTAVLVSGDEDFVYAVNAVAYKGCRVEIVGFRSNTAPKLIDVADCFIDLGEIADKVRKEFPHGLKYEDRDIHVSRQPPPPAPFIEPVPVMTPVAQPCAAIDEQPSHPAIGSVIETPDSMRSLDAAPDFIRVTDDQ
jgi:hypothetical protein